MNLFNDFCCLPWEGLQLLVDCWAQLERQLHWHATTWGQLRLPTQRQGHHCSGLLTALTRRVQHTKHFNDLCRLPLEGLKLLVDCWAQLEAQLDWHATAENNCDCQLKSKGIIVAGF